MYVSESPGSLVASVFFSALNAPVSDAAAKTLSDPLSFAAVVPAVVGEEEPEALDGLLLLPQAAARSSNMATTAARRLETRDIEPPRCPRFSVVELRLVANYHAIRKTSAEV